MPDEIDRVVADFRGWIDDLLSDGRDHRPAGPPAAEVDLYTLVSQFTALRHEVNLQTKAARAAVEQNARLIEQRPPADEAVRPLVKALVDVADVLTVALRQVEKVGDALEPLREELGEPLAALRTIGRTEAEPPGWFGRLVGRRAGPAPAWLAEARATDEKRAETARAAGEHIRRLTAGVTDGYAMSLRRVERVLPQFGLEPLPCVGRPFDPDTMEVVEVAAGTPPGTVLEEVRRGYRWNGSLFRPAQVKVAR